MVKLENAAANRGGLVGWDEVAGQEPVALLHTVGRAHMVWLAASVVCGDDGQLAGFEGAIGQDAVGEADHGAHGDAGRGRGIEAVDEVIDVLKRQAASENHQWGARLCRVER